MTLVTFHIENRILYVLNSLIRFARNLKLVSWDLVWPSLRTTREREEGVPKGSRQDQKRKLSNLLKIQVLSEAYENFSFQKLPSLVLGLVMTYSRKTGI